MWVIIALSILIVVAHDVSYYEIPKKIGGWGKNHENNTINRRKRKNKQTI